jgi:hypothetical protein
VSANSASVKNKAVAANKAAAVAANRAAVSKAAAAKTGCIGRNERRR